MDFTNIKKGEYVRMKNGNIGKVLYVHHFKDNTVIYGMRWGNDKDYSISPKAAIAKYSKNIIDLIEIGDFVNGMPINYIETNNEENEKIVWFDAYDMADAISFREEDIKTVLTKELFEKNVFKIKGV